MKANGSITLIVHCSESCGLCKIRGINKRRGIIPNRLKHALHIALLVYRDPMAEGTKNEIDVFSR